MSSYGDFVNKMEYRRKLARLKGEKEKKQSETIKTEETKEGK